MNYNSSSPDTVFYQQIQQPIRYRYERAYPHCMTPKFVQHQFCTLCHNPIPISSKYDSYPALVGICPNCFEQLFYRRADVPVPYQQYTQPIKKAKTVSGPIIITPIKPIPIRTTIDKKVEEDLRSSNSPFIPVYDRNQNEDTTGLDILSKVASESTTPVDEEQQQQQQTVVEQNESYSSDLVNNNTSMIVEDQTSHQADPNSSEPPPPTPSETATTATTTTTTTRKRRHITPKAQFLVCSTCSQTKPYKEFTTKRTGERTRTCKVCSERKKNYYQRNICKRRRYDDDAYYF